MVRGPRPPASALVVVCAGKVTKNCAFAVLCGAKMYALKNRFFCAPPKGMPA
ncbi:tRNA pseudouridine synthase B [Prevotella dentalis DSM 3688]|uniref:tRNA pseudouridine synthase B n=1 Tax=Prevotella dentalis (strain ATCC 49559 / DSM 3688 / JCM 13448 / NCTC 12043 / ES 2772) TaxID=908937 RepID=F9D506_PREDD|nr:tRNA pseudouridine synthase B [Prevotella dentalis DSM 3688]